MDNSDRRELTLFHVINLSRFFDDRNSTVKLSTFKVKGEKKHVNRHTLMTLKKFKINYPAETKLEGKTCTEDLILKKFISQQVI